MASGHQFEHLPLVLKHQGPARLPGGGSDSEQTKRFQQNRSGHSSSLRTSITTAKRAWEDHQQARREQGAPELETGIPLVLKLDTSLDLDDLRRQFEFEIVAEEEEGYVIVVSEDTDLTIFEQKVRDFATAVEGSGNIARVHELGESDNQEERLRQVLSERLFEEWGRMPDDAVYVCDVGIGCTGNWSVYRFTHALHPAAQRLASE